MKVDHIFLVLGLIIIAALAGRLDAGRAGRRLVIVQECALFYGAGGPAAIRECEREMAAQHPSPAAD